MYQDISPEPKLQFSQTGRPNFLQSHKLNQIKPSNLKKFLDLVGVWMEPRNYGFHLGPKKGYTFLNSPSLSGIFRVFALSLESRDKTRLCP